MPQLDLITFFPQFFWCFICFFGFFLYFSYYIIPQIATILKFRQKKLIALANEINQKKDGSSHLLIEYDKIVHESFQEIKDHLDTLVTVKSSWVSFNLEKLNTTTLGVVTQRLLKNSFEKEYNN
ncbi:ATP synthase F0 subunit 8 (mitochondrion) [Hemiselmis andersenii]|uniref:ATP synthase F0 subunit 8 n=1 Tax=Hemiselmis andersenii TaxID=464988 RepID=B2MWS7_HEMAN|nr:ATP synthase F0 subunit 8 [Hemiselmis andersenii]ACC78219.1 ATP synthase F0 subunit 8 [Hemiselmis andersenii]